MVSANVVETLTKILPVDQNLVPVALKRKLEYSGHYMQEYVDRDKVKLYFHWFHRHNHLFEEMHLDESLITKFEQDAMDLSEIEDKDKDEYIVNHDEILKQREIVDDLYDSEEEEDKETTEKLEKEHISCDHSSFITDKYMEDMNAPTVANKFSDMILHFEISSQTEQIFNPDSEQAFYVEDEIYISDDEDEEDDAELSENFSSEEDIKSWNEIRYMKNETRH